MIAPAVPPQSVSHRMVSDIVQAVRELRSDFRHLARYWLGTESHVYAFSIAANVLLSFFPFMLVMIALCRHLLHWPAAEVAMYVAIRDYFPGETGRFLAYNLKVAADNSRQLEWVSILLLLFTANGIFLPLEVALNRAWGAASNRTLLRNQALSMALIFGCGALALLSGALTGAGQVLWSVVSGQNVEDLRAILTDVRVVHWAPMPVVALFKVASIPVTILILFLVFWLLPNVKVPWRAILPRAAVIGLVLEALKWINLAVWPWLYAKFSREYGPFVNSVTIVTWSFLGGLLVLGGAVWTARRTRMAVEAEEGMARNRAIQDRMGAETHPQSQTT